MKTYLLLPILCVWMVACGNNHCTSVPPQNSPTSWEDILTEKMPYLGHRNWIVVTDMAYPLQSGAGITTLFADEPYEEVLRKVQRAITNSPHVFAHVYWDKELAFIPESDVPGIDAQRTKMQAICGGEVQRVPHETLIARLDEAGQLFHVIIIKTPLVMPYTSTFFELDCAYWDAARQERLETNMKNK